MSTINEEDYTYDIGDIVRIVEFAGFYYPDNIPDYYSEWMVVKDSRNLDYDDDYPGPQLLPVVFNEKLGMYEVAADFAGGISIDEPNDYHSKSSAANLKVSPNGAKCVPACFLEKTGGRAVLLAAKALPSVKGCNVPDGVITILYVKVGREDGRMRLVGTVYDEEVAALLAKNYIDRYAENGSGESGEGGGDTGQPS